MHGYETTRAAIIQATNTLKRNTPSFGRNDLVALMPHLEELGLAFQQALDANPEAPPAPPPAAPAPALVADVDIEHDPGLDGPAAAKPVERCRKCGSLPCDCDPPAPPK